jgi:ComF family protein
MRIIKGLGKIFAAVWGVVFPPECIACKALLGTGEPLGLCAACYAKLPWWDVSRVLPPELPPAVASFKAPLLYKDQAREVILKFKFADYTAYTPVLARLLLTVMPPVEVNVVLVPVPMHTKRLRKRGYNQAAMLVRELARLGGYSYDLMALQRVTWGEAQASKSKAQRQKLSSNDFRVDAGRLVGKNVVVIDDIYTTGATAWACALALKKAGVRRVDVRTLAYTPPGEVG